MRALTLLEAFYPRALNLDDLALMDYALVHSADFAGPPSLHPKVPGRLGEVTVKRPLLEYGLEVLNRAGLATISLDQSGIRHVASEESTSFLALLESEYLEELRDCARWLAREFPDSSFNAVGERLREIFREWSVWEIGSASDASLDTEDVG